MASVTQKLTVHFVGDIDPVLYHSKDFKIRSNQFVEVEAEPETSAADLLSLVTEVSGIAQPHLSLIFRQHIVTTQECVPFVQGARIRAGDVDEEIPLNTLILEAWNAKDKNIKDIDIGASRNRLYPPKLVVCLKMCADKAHCSKLPQYDTDSDSSDGST